MRYIKKYEEKSLCVSMLFYYLKLNETDIHFTISLNMFLSNIECRTFIIHFQGLRNKFNRMIFDMGKFVSTPFNDVTLLKT